MKKYLQITVYSFIYLVLLLLLLLFAQKKYPEIVTWNLITVSMIYLATIFTLSTAQIFVKWKSVPSAGILIATILYMNFVMSNISINYHGTLIQINLSNILILLYAILILKTLMLIYDDIKQEKITLKATKRRRGSQHLPD